MDLSFSPADEQFRSELRAWLDQSVTPEMRTQGYWAAMSDQESFEVRRAWEAAKADAGWSGIQWPTEYGGRGGTPAQMAIYDEEMRRAGAPESVNTLGLTFLAPTVMLVGTDAQKKEIIDPLLHNQVIWCQGFSEPGAGSDLAALKTRAVLEGDEWVVNGQKVWTTNAMHADTMFALVRTGPADGPKHAGITMLLIDMHAAGVEARPLRQMSGQAEFGEVFFTDVRVPKDAVLGEVGEGWGVAMTLLSFERGSSAIGQYTGFRKELDTIIDLAKGVKRNGRSAAQDPMLRQRIATSVVELELLRLHSLSILTDVEQGRDLGAEASMTKLQWSEAHQDMGELFVDVAGLAGQTGAAPDGADLSPLQTMFLWSRSETIWGGSSQVQRNIVAERVLGLPR